MKKQILNKIIHCARKCETLGLYDESDTLTALAHKELLNPDYAEDYILNASESEPGNLLCENRQNVPNHPLNAFVRYYPEVKKYLCRDCASKIIGEQDAWQPYDVSQANLRANPV